MSNFGHHVYNRRGRAPKADIIWMFLHVGFLKKFEFWKKWHAVNQRDVGFVFSIKEDIFKLDSQMEIEKLYL